MNRNFSQRVAIFIVSFILLGVMGLLLGTILSDMHQGFWISAIVTWGGMIYFVSAGTKADPPTIQ